MEFQQKNGSEMDFEPILSVSEFLEYVNLLLGKRSVVVEGEISSFNVSQGKWVFFDLRDAQGTVTCFTMLFRVTTPLTDGMKVRITGTPRVHQKSGRFSIFVDKIELSGEGALRKAFELTKAKLQKEGIFDVARKRSLPVMPQKIGLICSSESAAYTDFMRILNQRWGGLEIYLAHVHVQGEQAVKEIVGAFEFFNVEDTGVETIILIRGGGSLEDLQAFNSEAVARAVFGSKIPVVCGVGHERDESLADYAADVRAATPTHAATLVVPDKNECAVTLDGRVRTLYRSLDHALEWQRARIDRSSAFLSHAVEQFTQKPMMLIQRLQTQGDAFHIRVKQSVQEIQHYERQCAQLFDGRLRETHQALVGATRNLTNMSPLTVIARGYSIIKREGKVVKSVAQLEKGDDVAMTLSDGEIRAEVL